MQQENNKILVADTAFLEPELLEQHNFVNVFPMHEGDGAYRSTIENLLKRSKVQSDFYRKVLPKLLLVFREHNPELSEQNYNVVRPTLVWMTSFFCDRTIRVLHTLDKYPSEVLSALRTKENTQFDCLDDQIQSWQFNQSLIVRISKALQIKTIASTEEFSFPEYPVEHVQKSLLFLPPSKGMKELGVRILNKLFSKLKKFSNPFAKYQPIGFHDDYYFSKRGFSGPFGFFRSPVSFDFYCGKKDLKKRELLKSEIKNCAIEDFKDVLRCSVIKVSDEQLYSLAIEFIETFIDYFPTGYLEGSNTNLERALSALKPHNFKAVIGNDTISKYGHFFSAAAQRLGKDSISNQHGGHYGYIQDMAFCGQLEFPMCTKFISWGWTKLEEHFEPCNITALPSPKLSEKVLKSDYIESINSNQKDILYYSNLFHRFPHSSMSAHSRPDFIDEIFDSHGRLFQAANNANLSIIHKPYNMKFVDLYKNQFDQLQNTGGNGYQLLDSKVKGLSPEIIKTCKILVWDQIGSGTLECFTSRVPTMVYWERIYSREIPWAKDLITSLETEGIIHSNPISLINEVKTYRENPALWHNKKSRVDAINRFCEKYARHSDDWPAQWKAYFKKNKLSKE